MSHSVTDPKPDPAALPVQEEPVPLPNSPNGSRPFLPKFDNSARNISLLVVAILASLPIAYAARSTTAAQQVPERKEEKKDGQPAPDKEKKGGQPTEKANGEAKGLTITGPTGLRIALDSPAAILSRAKELGLEEKQRQELEKLVESAREQARKLLTDKQRQQLGEIPPEWLSMMQMAQLQETLQQMQQMMRQSPMGKAGQGAMGQGGQMQDMMQMMRMMQMMGQGGQGQMPMGQGGSGHGGNGQDMMQMMRMMQQMMGQGGTGQGGMGQGGSGQGGQMQDMMQMMRMMQMMGQGGQKSKGG